MRTALLAMAALGLGLPAATPALASPAVPASATAATSGAATSAPPTRPKSRSTEAAATAHARGLAMKVGPCIRAA